MSNPARMVLVDGPNLVFRAFYAIPANLSTATGLHTNAIYGFATMFRKLLAGKTPEYGAVVFDPPGPTFRDEAYDAYKADRAAMPEELAEQLPWIEKLIAAHHFARLQVPGYEADDVIGTLTRMALEADMEVFIVSSDKDFAQLVGDRVRMVDTMRDITYDAELVRKKWGVPPHQMVDRMALTGDKIDNVPGVRGIGKKTAAQLLEEHGTLDGVLENLEALSGRARKALETHREDAILSRRLVRIEQHVPLEIGLDDLAFEPPSQADLNRLYRELEFYSLLSQSELSRMAAERASEDYRVLTEPTAASAALDALPVDEPTAVQPLFDLPSAVTGRLVGLAFSPPQQAAFYLPLAGAGRTLDFGEMQPSLRRYFEDSARPKVAHDVKTLWMLLERHQIDLARDAIFDTQLASFLVDPTKIIPHQLGQVVKEYLHRTVQPVKGVIGSGRKEKAFSEVDVERAGPYACHLAEAVAELRPLLARRVEEEGHHLHLREVELKLAFVLGEMELTGIRVDPDDLDRMGEELAERLADYERRIHEMAGKAFNIASPKQLSEVLFEDLGLPVIKRTKTGYSTNAEVLERLVPRHPIASLLLEYRKLAKLITTYTSVLKEAVNPQTGRIHASFQQTVGATGRLITTDPDLQRTPIRTPEGRRIRRAFIPAESCKLISADWSQVELRLLAHFSGDARLVESFRRGVDVHRRTAGQIFDCDPDSVSDVQRNVGKTVNYATIYGQGATSLGQILGVARSEAQRYIDSYFAAYSGVREWLDRTIETAEQNGYVTTLLRRRRYIPELASNNPMTRQAGRRIAANTPIQGSAADICKLAMLGISLDFEAAGLLTRMVLQIHDELLFEAPHDEVDSACRVIRERMETIYPLGVPLVVDIGVGMSWEEAH